MIWSPASGGQCAAAGESFTAMNVSIFPPSTPS